MLSFSLLVQKLLALVVAELLRWHQLLLVWLLLFDLIQRFADLDLLVVLLTENVQEIATLVGLAIVQEVDADHSIMDHRSISASQELNIFPLFLSNSGWVVQNREGFLLFFLNYEHAYLNFLFIFLLLLGFRFFSDQAILLVRNQRRFLNNLQLLCLHLALFFLHCP